MNVARTSEPNNTQETNEGKRMDRQAMVIQNNNMEEKVVMVKCMGCESCINSTSERKKKKTKKKKKKRDAILVAFAFAILEWQARHFTQVLFFSPREKVSGRERNCRQEMCCCWWWCGVRRTEESRKTFLYPLLDREKVITK